MLCIQCGLKMHRNAKEKGIARIRVEIKDSFVLDLISKAKAKQFEAKATASILKDPRGQGLVLGDTSLVITDMNDHLQMYHLGMSSTYSPRLA